MKVVNVEPITCFSTENQPDSDRDNFFSCVHCSENVVFPQRSLEDLCFAVDQSKPNLVRLTQDERYLLAPIVKAFLTSKQHMLDVVVAVDFHCPKCMAAFVVGFSCSTHPQGFLLGYKATMVATTTNQIKKNSHE